MEQTSTSAVKHPNLLMISGHKWVLSFVVQQSSNVKKDIVGILMTTDLLSTKQKWINTKTSMDL